MVRRVEVSGVAIAGACVGCELATRQTHGYAEQRRTRDALGLFTTSWIGPEANLGPTVTIRLDYRSVLYPGLRALSVHCWSRVVPTTRAVVPETFNL
jgi:hypothetical protein